MSRHNISMAIVIAVGSIFITPVSVMATTCNASSFSGGDGSSGTPFQVSNAAQLQAMDSSVCLTSGYSFQQTADIDLAGVAWEPIDAGGFDGTYDGDFKTISNMTVTGSVGGGLFSVINGGTVENLRIENADVNTTSSYSGIIAAELKSNSTVSKIRVVNSQLEGSAAAGGLVGITRGAQGSRSVISEVFLDVEVQAGSGNAGGIAAQLEWDTGTVENSFFSGSVDSLTGQYTGGIVGYGIGPTIRKTVSIGTITGGTAKRGGILGQNAQTTVVDDSYFLDTGVVQLGSNFGTSKTESELKNIATFASPWTITDDKTAAEAGTATETWLISPDLNNGYPVLVWEAAAGYLLLPASQAAPAVYSGPLVFANQLKAEQGADVTISGERLASVSRASINDVDLEIVNTSATSITLKIPNGLEPGIQNLSLHSAIGKLLILSAFEISSAEFKQASTLLGPDDGDFSAWTKRSTDGLQVKFYAKFPKLGQKIQFMVQNDSGEYEELAWLRVEKLDDSGSYENLQNGAYFIRTFKLESGKNRLRIYVDGKQLGETKTYVN